MKFEVADAEALPYADGSFDVALSTFGMMFAPDHGKTAAEALRVVRSGGRIGMANWTPEGFIGQLFKLIGRHLPPPAGLASPALWGTETAHRAAVRPREPRTSAASGGCSISATSRRRTGYRSSATSTGRRTRRSRRLPPAGQARLEADLIELLERLNVGGRRSLVVPGEYLETVIVKH